jgi:hypothetical protein
MQVNTGSNYPPGAQQPQYVQYAGQQPNVIVVQQQPPQFYSSPPDEGASLVLIIIALGMVAICCLLQKCCDMNFTLRQPSTRDTSELRPQFFY